MNCIRANVICSITLEQITLTNARIIKFCLLACLLAYVLTYLLTYLHLSEVSPSLFQKNLLYIRYLSSVYIRVPVVGIVHQYETENYNYNSSNITKKV